MVVKVEPSVVITPTRAEVEIALEAEDAAEPAPSVAPARMEPAELVGVDWPLAALYDSMACEQ